MINKEAKMTKKFNMRLGLIIKHLNELKSMFTVSQAMAKNSFDSTIEPIKDKTYNPDPPPDHEYPSVEQPPASEFTKRAREINNTENVPKWLVRRTLGETCDRLDAETKKNCETERYPIGSMSAMRKEINQLETKLDASEVEQLPTSKLTKGLRQNVREFPDFPEHLWDLFERDILKACDRLDASEASRKELLTACKELCKEYLQNLGTKYEFVSCITPLKGIPDYWRKALAAIKKAEK